MIYKSCESIEQGISFMHEDMRLCCNVSHEGGGFEKNPYLRYENTKSIDWNDIFKYKDSIRTANQSESVFPACKGCLYFEERHWDTDNKKLSYFNFNHWRDCNTKCIYCHVRKDPNPNEIYPVFSYLKELDKNNFIADNGVVMFGGGDISFLPEFDDIVKLFLKYNYRFNIATCATKHLRIIDKLLKNGLVEIRISVDSAREETYKKIKCTNYYHQVWQNIKSYAKKQACEYSLRLKYIIIPGLNDNEEEILLWLKKTKEYGVKSVILDIESSYCSKFRDHIPEHILKLFEFTQKKASELGLYYMVFDHASQVLSLHNSFQSEYYFTKDITQGKLEQFQQQREIRLKNSFIKKLFGRKV